MYKKIIALSLGAAFALSLVGCTQTTKTFENWNMSQEAQTYKENLKTNGGKEYFQQGIYFDSWLESLNARPKTGYQTFPTVTLNHQLSCQNFSDGDVYSLSKTGYENIVLYIHGGAYVEPLIASHALYCDKLVDTLNAKVVMPLYPLAPQNTWESAYHMLDQVYTELLNENKPIYIMGDSAGGGLSLAYTEYLQIKGVKTPDKMVLFSPWLDVTLTNPEIDNFEDKDLTLSCYGTRKLGKLWAGDTDTKYYKISPIYGNLDKLPDMLVFVGTDEILYPDVIKLYNQATNTNIKLVIGDGFWHVFTIYSIPEQQKSFDLIKNFCK